MMSIHHLVHTCPGSGFERVLPMVETDVSRQHQPHSQHQLLSSSRLPSYSLQPKLRPSKLTGHRKPYTHQLGRTD
ncbi:hypothetical protein KEM48_004100 [Puccinia striiformis f. sp. tritici PST-130]|nr:hypothetical protein KEM48_004100 [Puccinia striiformis f. sp. tritici PST-130]